VDKDHVSCEIDKTACETSALLTLVYGEHAINIWRVFSGIGAESTVLSVCADKVTGVSWRIGPKFWHKSEFSITTIHLHMVR
jgi:hypothetical protein